MKISKLFRDEAITKFECSDDRLKYWADVFVRLPRSLTDVLLISAE